jgi:hypothetical protein
MNTDAPALGTLFDLEEYAAPRLWRDSVDWQMPQRETGIAAFADPPCVSHTPQAENRSTGPTEAPQAILGPGAARLAYRGYSPDWSDAEIRAAYRLRYGCDPAELRRLPAAVLAGPVVGGER